VWARSGTGKRQNVHYEIFSKVGLAKCTFQGFFSLGATLSKNTCTRVRGLMLHQMNLVNLKHTHATASSQNCACTTQQMCHIMILLNDCFKIKDESNKIKISDVSKKYCFFMKGKITSSKSVS
jgi:hypothetical protein